MVVGPGLRPLVPGSVRPDSPGGEFPAAPHDKEAVIPLTCGREAQVLIEGSSKSAGNAAQSGHTLNIALNGVKDFGFFRKSKSQFKPEMLAARIIADQRNAQAIGRIK